MVDDEPNARAALAELLRDEGYVVETAADGLKALLKLDALVPDLLLTDLDMPGMNGMELMERAHAADPERVVVVMTAHGSSGTGVAAMRRGALGYLAKPLDVDELMLVIERGLERRRLRAETTHLRQCLADAEHAAAGLPPIPGATLADLERHAILKTMQHTGGSTSRAAAILGISARTIQYRLRAYDERCGPGMADPALED